MMRLPSLNRKYTLKHRVMLAVMRVMSGHRAPDVVRMHLYRYEFFGKHFGRLFQEAMRGPSDWGIFEREIMATFVSSLNQCVF